MNGTSDGRVAKILIVPIVGLATALIDVENEYSVACLHRSAEPGLDTSDGNEYMVGCMQVSAETDDEEKNNGNTRNHECESDDRT